MWGVNSGWWSGEKWARKLQPFPLAPRLCCDSPLILFGRHSLAAVCRKWRFPESLLGCGWTLNSPGASLKNAAAPAGDRNMISGIKFICFTLLLNSFISIWTQWPLRGGGVNTSFDLITTVADGNIGCVVAVLVWWPRDQTNSFWSQTKQKRCKLMEPNELSGQQNTVDFK